VMYCSLSFVGWFLLGCLGFLLFLGFTGSVFPLSSFFSVLVSFLDTSCMLRGAFMLFTKFLCLPIKKKNLWCLLSQL
jgi:hypothetical protein